MKYIITILFFITTFLNVNAQRVSKVTMTNTGNTEMISIGLDENAVINISLNGDIINFGTEYFSERVSNYSRIEAYNGRTEMYTTYDDKAYSGKLKYIGRTAITYYASYEDETVKGKIKSIGNLNFTYYMIYDGDAEKGKIKSIGSNAVTFYSSYENEAVKGKLKTLGNTEISYYSSFEDKAFKGKIKNIGQVSFSYYPSFDRQMAGAMKTGSYQQSVNGVVYLIR